MVNRIVIFGVALASFSISAFPQNTEDRRLAELMVGKWRSPRHDYHYRADGTWIMLPGEIDGVKMTHGVWRIEHGKLIEHSFAPGDTDRTYAIQKLNRHEILFGGVYHMVRLSE